MSWSLANADPGPLRPPHRLLRGRPVLATTREASICLQSVRQDPRHPDARSGLVGLNVDPRISQEPLLEARDGKAAAQSSSAR